MSRYDLGHGFRLPAIPFPGRNRQNGEWTRGHHLSGYADEAATSPASRNQ